MNEREVGPILLRNHVSYAPNTNRYRWAKTKKGDLPLSEDPEMLYHHSLFKWKDRSMKQQLGRCATQNDGSRRRPL